LTVPLLGAGVERLAIRPALVPVRMLFHERRVKGGMVDDQIHYELKTQPLSGLNHLFELGQRWTGRGIKQARVEGVVILDGIEAARITGEVKGVDEHPVESQTLHPLQMRSPLWQRSSKQGKQVIDARAGSRVCCCAHCCTCSRRPWVPPMRLVG